MCILVLNFAKKTSERIKIQDKILCILINTATNKQEKKLFNRKVDHDHHRHHQFCINSIFIKHIIALFNFIFFLLKRMINLKKKEYKLNLVNQTIKY